MQISHIQFKQAGAIPAPMDHATLVTSLLAAQSASATAIANTHYQVSRSIDSDTEQAIVTLLQGNLGWRAAAAVLNGSFHPGIAPLIVANTL
jgi:hypothetical protein